MTGYIYRIRNLVNGKFYIGSTRQNPPRNRWNTGHVRDLRNGKHDNQRLQHSWNKHGEKAFVFEVIDTLTYSEDIELERKEQEWLDKTNPQYNICRKVVRNEWGVQKAAEKNSKDYILTSPNGDELIVKNLRKFCRERGLNSSCLGQVANGHAIQHRGWTCRYANMTLEMFESIKKKKKPLIIKESKPQKPKKPYQRPPRIAPIKIKLHKETQLQLKFGPMIRESSLGPKKTKYNRDGLLYIIVDPEGKEFVCNDLKAFSTLNKLNYCGLRTVLHGKTSHSNRWKVRYEGKQFSYVPKPRIGNSDSWFIKNIKTKIVQPIFNLKGFAKKEGLRKDDQYKELRKGNRIYQFSRHDDFRDVPVKPGVTKRYQLTRPDGSQISIDGLRKFCRDEGLDEKIWSKRLSDCALRERKEYRGWKAQFI